MRNIKQLLIGMTTAVSLAVCGSACTLGPDYERPEVSVPDVWQTKAAETVDAEQGLVQTWWDTLEDPVLIDLLERAEAANLDLEIAVARISEARASWRISKSDWYPEVSGSLEGSGQGIPENVPLLGGETIEQYSLGVGMSWEIDVFGRIRRTVESANAAFEATIEDYRDLLVVLLADVGFNYVDAITLQERIQLAEANVAKQSESMQLTRDRFNAGLTSALDVAQAESNLASTESRIPQLEIQLTEALNRIAVLLGENPGSVHDEILGKTQIPVPPEEVVVAIPANVLRQRPDIRRAERSLASQTALIGAAKADLYPRFSLSGFFGLASGDISDLIGDNSVAWNVGLPIIGNIFDGGKRRGRVQVQEARTRQLLSAYELTVLVAFEEVENALVAYVKEMVRRDSLGRAVGASQRSVDLVRTQYMTGLTNFQNVLDSERSLTEQQDLLAESEGLVVNNLITLYRALGGGWKPDPQNEESFTTAFESTETP